VRKSRSVLVLVAIAIGVLIGALFFRGEREKADTPDLPPIAIETE